MRDYTKPLLKDRLDLLTGRINRLERSKEEHVETLKRLLHVANEYYDLVLLDADRAGTSAPVLLEHADFVVVNLNQNMRDLECFLKKSDLRV